MDGGLLVAHQHVAQPPVLGQRIVQGQHGAAGIAEHGVDAAGDQGVEQEAGAGQGDLAGGWREEFWMWFHALKSIEERHESASYFQLELPLYLNNFHKK